MGDMAEVFNDMRKAKQAKRASNTVGSTEILKANNIVFESKNGGAHLRIQHVCGPIDFWPSTGLWLVHFNKTRFRGIKKLLEYYGKPTK